MYQSLAPLQSINNHNHSGCGSLIYWISLWFRQLLLVPSSPPPAPYPMPRMHDIRSFHIPLPVREGGGDTWEEGGWYHTGSAVFGHIPGVVHQGEAYCQAWRCRGNIIHWDVPIVH
jgi:hypothetical protein